MARPITNNHDNDGNLSGELPHGHNNCFKMENLRDALAVLWRVFPARIHASV